MSQIAHDFDELRRVSRLMHPERYTPDGQELRLYDSTCWHSDEERRRGCGDGWAHRLSSWERAEAIRAGAREEDVTAEPEQAPVAEEPVDLGDDDQPYARVRGEQ